MFSKELVQEMLRIFADRQRGTAVKTVGESTNAFAAIQVPRFMNEVLEVALPQLLNELLGRISIGLLKLPPDKREAVLKEWAAEYTGD